MIKYRKTDHPKWKWELTEDYQLRINDVVNEVIESEYVLVHPLGIFLAENYAINGVNLLPDRKVWMRGAFVHDALWQLVGLGKLPKEMVCVADRIFRDIISEDDNKLTAWLMWAGVRIGAKWRFGIRY
jgi:hypothetical protein